MFPLILAGALALYMWGAGYFAFIKKRKDYADIAWGPGFILMAWVAFILHPFSLKAALVNGCVTLWGVRLSLHIYLKNRGRKEDFRYKESKSFLKVFLVQGLILYVVSLPLVWANRYAEHIHSIAFGFFVILYSCGFLIETISDAQLLLFKQKGENRGKLLTRGMWSYVRHPNYLGEILIWWGFWVLTITLPFGWALIVSPSLITFLIIKVSGVAPLEEKMKDDPAFKVYAERVPCLFPNLKF